MKKRIAVLAAVCVLLSFAGCKASIEEPTTGPEETISNASEPEITTADITTEPVTETTVAETTTLPPPEGIVRPTEQVTYSEEGIPIANAYFSLMLPTGWDGRYRSSTAYEGDVMILTFKDKDSAEAEAGGVLFSLALVPSGADFRREDMERLHTLQSENDAYTLYVFYPQDEQTKPDTEQQYAAMQQQIDDVLKTLQPGEGFHF
jgi:hypothetical protein